MNFRSVALASSAARVWEIWGKRTDKYETRETWGTSTRLASSWKRGESDPKQAGEYDKGDAP
jgi:hypothetical protein